MASARTPITITYQKAGSQPPVFLAGSFSDPAWEPQEMPFTTGEDGEHTFRKEVFAEDGSTIQYKFRIGHSGWWVLDENVATVTDEVGNRNNKLEVTKNQSPDPEPTAAQGIAKPVHKDLLAVLSQDSPVSRSGSSTPDFARTAAEVADSAALLDKEEPAPDIPDDEAGRLGFRRLTSTPIKEVAKTAAEVADTAQLLDAEEAEEDAVVLDGPPPLFAHERLGPDEDGGRAAPEETHDGPPMFAYECVGVYQNETVPHEDLHAPEHDRSGGVDYDLDDFDLKDPTLERFPSNRDEILETVRRIETGLDEDRPYFEGVPPSPVVGPGLSLHDFGVDQLSSSPSVSPVMPRAVKRLEIPRVPQGSESPERSQSIVSLHSIVEESGADEEEDLLSGPRGVPYRPAARDRTSSDEDEGISLKGSTRLVKNANDTAASGQATPQRTPSPDAPHNLGERRPNAKPPAPVGGRASKETAESPGEDDSTTVNPENPKAASPRIVVHEAESLRNGGDASSVPKPTGAEDETVEANAAATSTSETPQDPQASDNKSTKRQQREDANTRHAAHDDANQGPTAPGKLPVAPEAADAADTANSTSIETSDTRTETHVVQRSGAGSAAQRAATPTSIHSAGLGAAKDGNWVKTFLRLVFVDWIGGFIRRLFGGGRTE